MSKEKEKPKGTPEQPENPVDAAQDAASEQLEEMPVITPEQLQEYKDHCRSIESERDELKDRYLRLAAEYENFRKRSAKESQALFSTAKADAVIAILPVYDNVERALKQPCRDEAYVKGVEMIMQQLCDIFKKLGVDEIDAAGCPFDPELHSAVGMVESEDVPEGAVAEVLQKGFTLNDKVIRHAMVTVAK